MAIVTYAFDGDDDNLANVLFALDRNLDSALELAAQAWAMDGTPDTILLERLAMRAGETAEMLRERLSRGRSSFAGRTERAATELALQGGL